ncbi:hypothetical protein OF83DRAFT_1035553, partial [Amylostereum chailletii]
FSLHLQWIASHEDVVGSDAADASAKEAAEGTSSPRADLPRYLQAGKLPINAAAAKQEYHAQIQARRAETWKASPRYQRLNRIDKKLPSNSFVKLAD